MRAVALLLVLASLSLAASAAAEWDLAWKPIESYIGRSAAVTKNETAETPVDGRAKTWCESALGALDTLGLGLLLFLR